MSLTAQELAVLMPDATRLESNEPEMESSLHYAQLALLAACLEWLWRERSDFFIGANLTIYFSREQLKNRDYLGLYLGVRDGKLRYFMESGQLVPTPEEAAEQAQTAAHQAQDQAQQAEARAAVWLSS